ncbi:MAG TPA: lysylphosphatidylglycerol synthase domain-containing protein [Gaiellaceae bacterium]|nr:lysylphosphatidylglycerol synthase domain-containing protein [Gaiellaceae bacterium]
MKPTRHAIALSVGAVVLLLALLAVRPQLGGHVGEALDVLGGASRPWLTLAFAAFLAAFLCTVAAWRAAFASAGARIPPFQAAARLAVGSLVNAFAPAKLGDAVKIALWSRAIDSPGRLWTAGGAYAALTATRSLTLASVVVVASATGAVPLWPVFLLVGGAACVALAATASSRIRRHPRLATLLAGIAALVRSPRALAAVVAWTAGMQLARLAGTVAAASALGLPHPLLAALVILPALDLAGAIPLTPGSIGIGSGAVAVALASRGIGTTQALAVGLAIQGVETLVSVSCGSLGVAYLVEPSPRVSRAVSRVAVVGGSACIAAVVGFVVSALV